MSPKINNLNDALQKISELESKIEILEARIQELEKITPAGRKVHDDKWKACYDVFVKHYEAGESIPLIIETTPFSRRTVYRYKEYYDRIHKDKS